MTLELFQQLGTAFGLAALIGMQRESATKEYKHKRFAGIRTFAIVGLLGALSQLLTVYSPVFEPLLIGGFLLLIVTAYVATSLMTKTAGLTTELAAIVAFINGVFCAHEQYVLATTITMVVLGTLHFRTKLRSFASHVSRKELISTIEFMIIAFIVLPLLPNVGYGPFDVFNPFLIWLMVVLISGISFISYVTVKLIGAKRGLGLTGFLAGLISSTALTLSFSHQSKKNENIVNPYVFAILIASSAVFIRILIEVAVVNKDILKPLLIPMISMGLTGGICALFFWARQNETRTQLARGVQMESPLQFKPALKFGVFFAFILFLTKIANFYYGAKGIYAASFLSAFADVDAITISTANMAKDGLASETAVYAITLAVMTNVAIKAGIFALFGNRKVAKLIAISFGVILSAGGISLIFV